MVKGWDFCIAALTWKNGTTFQVGRQQVGTPGVAPQTVAYDGLAPTHPLTSLQLSYPHAVPAVAWKTLHPQPRLVQIYRLQRDVRPGWPEHMRLSILSKCVTNWPI